MRAWSRYIGIGIALGIVAGLVPFLGNRSVVEAPTSPLGKASRALLEKPLAPDLTGLDLLRLDVRPERVTAPLPNGQQAELTLDPKLQRTVTNLMRRVRIPEAGTVLMDVRTGKLLVYSSYVNEGEPFDVNLRAQAPAASIFKVITGSALIERAKLNADTKQCYHGGRSRISKEELLDNPDKDTSCATLGEAMGRSLNVVFGRLAQKHLKPEDVTRAGGAFGFGAAVPFVVKNEAPTIDIPKEPVEFARASAGFWHTTLSPLAAVGIAQTVARDGLTLEPRIVARVLDKGQVTWEPSDKPKVLRRAVSASTAKELTRMMTHTVMDGSARLAFRDNRGKPYLPGIAVAGKTGTLTKADQERFYTWFVGFAPAEQPEVAVATLVVNNPSWHIKASELARDTLRAYFAKQSRPGVTSPN